MNDILIYILIFIVSYLIGSLSPAILISKLMGKNIMDEGSGNAGATNAVRVLGVFPGICVFMLDFIKGFAVTFVLLLIFNSTVAYVASLAVVIGHIFSVFHKFKAGKGVAPSIGVMFAVDWRIALICLVFGIILVLITRRVSIGSISASIILIPATWFLHSSYIIFALIIALLIIFSHRHNIIRIFKGQEKPLF